MTPELTDELILHVMRARPGGIMTYVIRNILRMEHGFPRELATAPIRRRLQRLAREGKVAGGSLGPGCHAEWRLLP